MVAPVYAAAGTVLTGVSSTSANVAVPAGVVSGSVILVLMYVETTQTVTPPAGFTEAGNSPAVVTGAGAHDLHVYWKRATGADSGTYNFTISPTAWRSAVAVRFTGVISYGNPLDATNSAINTGTDSVSPAVSLTTKGPDRTLVWIGSCFVGGGNWPVVTGFAEQIEPGGNEAWAIDTKTQAAAGSTGSLSVTYSVGGGSASAWLGALLPVPSPKPVNKSLSVATGRAGVR